MSILSHYYTKRALHAITRKFSLNKTACEQFVEARMPNVYVRSNVYYRFRGRLFCACSSPGGWAVDSEHQINTFITLHSVQLDEVPYNGTASTHFLNIIWWLEFTKCDHWRLLLERFCPFYELMWVEWSHLLYYIWWFRWYTYLTFMTILYTYLYGFPISKPKIPFMRQF